MQDTLLRVFVVTLGLLMCPRDDPKIQEKDEDVFQGHEEEMLRGGENPEQDITSLNQEKMHEKGEFQDGTGKSVVKKKIMSDQYITLKGLDDNIDWLEDDERLLFNSDSSQLELPKHDVQSGMKTSHIGDEGQTDTRESFQLDMTGEQRESNTWTNGLSKLPGQQENPEETEGFISSQLPGHTKMTEDEEVALADWERDYLWYIWNILSFISMIRFFRKYQRNHSGAKQEAAFPVTCSAAKVPLPDSDILKHFYSQCLQVSSKKWKEEEFLEGFLSDLLESMKAICDSRDGMWIDDFQMVGVSDIIVPFTPSEPYSFQCHLWSDQATDLLPDMQVCAQIKLVEKLLPKGCHCQSPDADDDMVCLLHCESEGTKVTDVCDGPLCVKNSPFLSRSQVSRWFQSTLRDAWTHISHKYEFELIIRYMAGPGALAVRFRSGRKISFNMKPVVKFNTESHLYISTSSVDSLDHLWTLSLTIYEDRFFDHISQQLPENSCHLQVLKIAHFLHKRQTVLSGSSALKESHFTTALMHLLLTKAPPQWKPEFISCRLQDLLAFMGKSLEERLLYHVLIGNPLAQNVQLPAELTHTKPVNLFHHLVVHKCFYISALSHFHDMLRNANILILEYADKQIDFSI
ncbi:inositol 1,4,5-trisphosphate receptor-interacting protein [Aulostomus maculatus]